MRRDKRNDTLKELCRRRGIDIKSRGAEEALKRHSREARQLLHPESLEEGSQALDLCTIFTINGSAK
jgi:hypothetical protein